MKMRKIISLSIKSNKFESFGLYPASVEGYTNQTFFEIEQKLLAKDSNIDSFGVFDEGFLLDLNYLKDKTSEISKYSPFNFPYLSKGLLEYLGYTVELPKEKKITLCKSYDLTMSVSEWYESRPKFSKTLLEKFKKRIILLDSKLKNIIEKILKENKAVSYCYVMAPNVFREYLSYKEKVFNDLLKELHEDEICLNLLDSIRTLETIFLLSFAELKKVNIQMGAQPIRIENFEFFKELEPKFEERNIPILLSSSNYYVPYCDVVIKSIINSSTCYNNYDIIILEQDISEENKDILRRNEKKNISIRFLDPRAFYFDEPKFYEAIEEFGVTRFAPILSYRAFCPYFLKKYKKIIWLDCDLIVKKDLSDLYRIDIDGKYAGMVLDLAIMGFLNGSDKKLGEYYFQSSAMMNPYMYSNAGVVLLNLEKIRIDIPFNKFTRACLERRHAIPEQDTINALWEGNVKHIDMRWNVFSFGNNPSWGLGFVPVRFLEMYKQATKDPWIIHYVGPKKPWDELSVCMSESFWTVARTSPFYEEMLTRKFANTSETSTSIIPKIEKVISKLLPSGSRRGVFIKKIYRFVLR